MNTPDNYENRLMVKATWLHYKENLTQGEIAARLGISRVKVNRLIKLARQMGIVEINIKTPIPTYNEIEEQLVKLFNLKEAIVLMGAESNESLYEVIAQGTADWLVNHIKPNIDIGISLGRTLSHLPEAHFSSTDISCNFVDIIGGISQFDTGFQSYNVTSRMAERLHGQAFHLNAPTVVSSPKALKFIKKEPFIANVLDRARNCQIILLSCGPVDESALLYIHKYITKQELEQLKKDGAIGDVMTYFMDINGEHIISPIENRIVSLTIDEIRKIPLRVLVVCGDEKVPILSVALKKEYFNVLITDLRTAKKVLELVQKND